MKFAISFFFSISAFATPINVLHENIEEDANIYKTILEKDYSVPSELIQIKQTRNCEEVKKKGKLDMCLKNNGDLVVVSVDREFINDSLKVFQAP
jgi:hypothetical protein